VKIDFGAFRLTADVDRTYLCSVLGREAQIDRKRISSTWHSRLVVGSRSVLLPLGMHRACELGLDNRHEAISNSLPSLPQRASVALTGHAACQSPSLASHA